MRSLSPGTGLGLGFRSKRQDLLAATVVRKKAKLGFKEEGLKRGTTILQGSEQQAAGGGADTWRADCEEDTCGGRRRNYLVEFLEDAVRVKIGPSQSFMINGSALVKLVSGSATVMGYGLVKDLETLVCCSSIFSPALVVESNMREDEGEEEGEGEGEDVDIGEGSIGRGRAGDGATLELRDYRQSGDGKLGDKGNRTFWFEGLSKNLANQLKKRQKLNQVAESILNSNSKKRRTEKKGEKSPDFIADSKRKLESEIDYSSDDMEVENLVFENGFSPKNLTLGSPSFNSRKRKGVVYMDAENDKTPTKIQKKGGREIGVEDGEGEKRSSNFTLISEEWKCAAVNIINLGPGRFSAPCTDGFEGPITDWHVAVPPIIVICGPKNVGKSTFGQYLINCLLNRFSEVGFLETDVGQPSMTVAGCLSLHLLSKPIFASPQWHLQTPNRCFFFGDTTPKSNPESFLQCFVALYDYFRSNFYNPSYSGDDGSQRKMVPLVINTNGWVKGVGFDILVDLIRYAVPTHVVKISAQKGSKGLPPGAFWLAPNASGIRNADRTEVIEISTVVGDEEGERLGRRPTAEGRGPRFLAFLQRSTGQTNAFPSSPALYGTENLSAAVQLTATALMEHRPFQVPISKIQIVHLHKQVTPHQSLYAINGAVVGLGVPPSLPRGSQGASLPLCVGVGLVRSVDAEKGLIYMLTDVSVSVLQHVTVLLHGRIQLPSEFLQAGGLMSPYLSYHSIGAEGTGSAAIRSRNNLLRRPLHA